MTHDGLISVSHYTFSGGQLKHANFGFSKLEMVNLSLPSLTLDCTTYSADICQHGLFI